MLQQNYKTKNNCHTNYKYTNILLVTTHEDKLLYIHIVYPFIWYTIINCGSLEPKNIFRILCFCVWYNGTDAHISTNYMVFQFQITLLLFSFSKNFYSFFLLKILGTKNVILLLFLYTMCTCSKDRDSIWQKWRAISFLNAICTLYMAGVGLYSEDSNHLGILTSFDFWLCANFIYYIGTRTLYGNIY